MNGKGYKYLDHTADVQVECWGRSLEEAFEQVALSLMETITPNLSKIESKTSRKIEIQAEDKEALLFDYLTEFLYLFDVEQLVFGEIKVSSITKKETDYLLESEVKGEEFDRECHEIGTEVKAITYSFMRIEEKEDGVNIKVVFDV